MATQNNKEDNNKTFSEKLKERVAYATKQEEGKGTFWGNLKEATVDSIWLSVVVLPISIALEQLTNKVLKPAAEKLYRFVKRDPNAEMPEIAQSLFKVTSYLVWFPALIASQTVRKFVQGPPVQDNVDESDIERDAALELHQGKAGYQPLSKEEQKLAEESGATQQKGREPK